MLGHVVCRYFEKLPNYDVLDASFPAKFRKNSEVLDATDTNRLRWFLESFRPDIVINCIGLLIRGSKENPSNAIFINAFLPHFLSEVIHSWDGKLVQISTDCVFSGLKGNYTESDLKDANDIYGSSKSLGEVVNDKDITLRTSIIGPELNKNGEGLFQWFMNQKGYVNGFSRVYWSGLTTLELAMNIEAAINQEVTGLINLHAKQKISKLDLLNTIHSVFGFPDVSIIPYDKKIEDKSLVSERTDFVFCKKGYQEMLTELADFMNENSDLYRALIKPIE